MNKLPIQDYKSFGAWGQDRGGDVLGSLSEILGNIGGVMEMKKKGQQEKAFQKALSMVAQEQGVDRFVPPDMKPEMVAKSYDYKTQEPIGKMNLPTGEEVVAKTPQEKMSEMNSDDLMKLLAMRSAEEKSGGGGSSSQLNKLREDLMRYNSFRATASAADKPRFDAVINRIESDMAKLDPDYKPALYQATAEKTKTDRVNLLNRLKIDKASEFKKTGLAPADFEKWAVSSGYLK